MKQTICIIHIFFLSFLSFLSVNCYSQFGSDDWYADLQNHQKSVMQKLMDNQEKERNLHQKQMPDSKSKGYKTWKEQKDTLLVNQKKERNIIKDRHKIEDDICKRALDRINKKNLELEKLYGVFLKRQRKSREKESKQKKLEFELHKHSPSTRDGKKAKRRFDKYMKDFDKQQYEDLLMFEKKQMEQLKSFVEAEKRKMESSILNLRAQ